MSISSNYRIIGTSLLTYEMSISTYPSSNQKTFEDFRISLCTVNTETLESYLEDLLELKISDTRLFIKRDLRYTFLFAVAFGLVVSTLAFLLLKLSTSFFDNSLIHLFFICSAVLVPFCIFWQIYPQKILRRRITFAQVLTREISRRRGDGKKSPVVIGIQNFLSRKRKEAFTGLSGAAKEIVH